MVCELHFDAEDIHTTKRLKASAIPTHFCRKDDETVSNKLSKTNSCVNCILYETKLNQAELQIVRLQGQIATLKYTLEKDHLGKIPFGPNTSQTPIISPSVNYEMCELCCKELNQLEVETHLCLDMQKRISCPYCATSFRSTKHFLRHLTLLHRSAMQNDGKNIQYTCDKCPKKYGLAMLLEYHQKSHESTIVIPKIEPDLSDDSDYVMIEPIVTIDYSSETIDSSYLMNYNESIKALEGIKKCKR